MSALWKMISFVYRSMHNIRSDRASTVCIVRIVPRQQQRCQVTWQLDWTNVRSAIPYCGMCKLQYVRDTFLRSTCLLTVLCVKSSVWLKVQIENHERHIFSIEISSTNVTLRVRLKTISFTWKLGTSRLKRTGGGKGGSPLSLQCMAVGKRGTKPSPLTGNGLGGYGSCSFMLLEIPCFIFSITLTRRDLTNPRPSMATMEKLLTLLIK